jgi:hypothetical protein
MDNAYNLLFLQRSQVVVTCPSTWSVLGEHANRDETPIQSVLRGIQEELGFVPLFNYHDNDMDNIDDTNKYRRMKNGNDNDTHLTKEEEGVYYFHSSNDVDIESSSIIRATIQNITHYPLYYIRHYGPRNNNRIDSQLTYLWSVVVTTTITTTTTNKNNSNDQEEVDTTSNIQQLMHLDAEVADYKWMNIIEASEWLANDVAAKMIMVDSNKNDIINNSNVNNEEDDGPDMGDFCHSTIRSLYEVGLNSILQQQMSN